MIKPSAIVYTSDIILNKRNKVREQLTLNSPNIKNGNISAISAMDLSLLFELYDQFFFNNYFKINFLNCLSFTLSTRMTKAAGKTIIQRNMNNQNPDKATYEIRIGVNLFFKYYALEREKLVCGIKTKDSLEALLLVFEHELCHLIEFSEFRTSSCKQPRFKALANSLFGHTSSYHVLPTKSEISSQGTNKCQVNSAEPSLQVGDNVIFSYKGNSYKGVINKINKRATVMVAHKRGSYVSSDGQRFMKYYVPLQLLTKH